MRFNIVKTVFLKELREMMRDRRAMAVMFGVPLVLYPLLTIGLGSLGQKKATELKETHYKVAIHNAGAAPELQRRFAEKNSGVELVDSAHPWQEMAQGRIQAVIEVPANLQADLLAGKEAGLSIRLDRSRTESGFVENKIYKVVDAYQDWIVAQRLKALNISDEVLKGINRNVLDVASSGQRMGNYLAQLLPLLVLITGMLGALFPALSATTTERELGTLETLLVTPAGRGELLTAKAILVLLCGILTALLNVLSMSLVLWHTFSMADKHAGGLSVNFGSVALMFIAALPALVFFTTCVLIVGLIARTYREANSYATPAMLLPIASLALTIADVKTTTSLLLTPVANTTLVMRDVLRGQWHPGQFFLAFFSSLAYSGLLMSLAARLFSNEQLVNPAWEPLSLKGFGKKKRKPRLPAVDEVIVLFFVSLLLLFYIQPRLLGLGLLGMLAVTQLALIFAPTVLFGLMGKWNWRETFKLERPALPAIIGAALVGIGMMPAINLISHAMQRFWPTPPEVAEHVNKLFLPSLQEHPLLTAVMVGLLAGVFEELLFRGPIQTALARKSRPWTAIVVAAFLFAAMHMDVRGLPVRMLLGVVLGWIAMRSGSIFPAIAMHACYDAAALGLAALELHYGIAWSMASITWWTPTAIGASIALAAGGWWIIWRAPLPGTIPPAFPVIAESSQPGNPA